MKKSPDQFKNVGLTGNTAKHDFGQVVLQVARLLTRAGRTVLCDAETAAHSGLKARTVSDTGRLAREADLLLVFGGDGTMLRVARDTAGSTTPILGINIGGLGFLTAGSSAELARALSNLWQGRFTLESRDLIEVVGESDGQAVRHIALNDVVISRGETPRLIELEVAVNDEPLTRYRCDGLIISSPTGSTAYSLAAGGALVHPSAEVFTLTPICPHTLSNRSVIVDLDSTIRVRVISPKPATALSADGQVICGLARGDTVSIRRSRKRVRLMRLPNASFFETLRRKLHWRGASL